MSRLPRSPRPGGRTVGVILSAALALVGAAAGAPVAVDTAQAQDRLGPRGEVGLPAPTRYAIIRQGPGGVQMLVASGDLLFHPQDPTRAFSVVRVEPGALVLRQVPRGQPQALRPGSLLPGFPSWVVTGTVLLEELHYRYRVVDRIAHPDPVLLALEGARAVLEVETVRSPTPAAADPLEAAASAPASSPPSRATLNGELLEKVRVREASPGLYEVPAADVQAVLDNAGRVLADLWPTVQPHLSLQTGLQYQITSAGGDGVLSKQGFTVTAPKLAQRAGIEVGDTILSVNRRPVDGFASLYAIFRAVRQDPALRTVHVELDRRGTRLTKTYQIL